MESPVDCLVEITIILVGAGGQIVREVATENVGVLAETWIDFAETLAEFGLVEGLEDCLDARRLLGVTETGIVLLVCEVGDKDRFHEEST